jgi:hypothetical protein
LIHNGSRRTCNNLEESRFHEAIICACCAKLLISRGNFCRERVHLITGVILSEVEGSRSVRFSLV